MPEKTLPNEEAAERLTNIAGWVCKTCRRFYGDDEGSERTARFCCEKDHACGTEGCKNRAIRAYIYCDPCIKQRDFERWKALPEVPWDGETPLVLDDDDKFFMDEGELEEYLAEHGVTVEDLQLVICVPDRPPYFEMSEWLSDHLPEHGAELDDKRINDVVNGWIEKHCPKMWVPGKTRPTIDSVKILSKPG